MMMTESRSKTLFPELAFERNRHRVPEASKLTFSPIDKLLLKKMTDSFPFELVCDKDCKR